MTTNDITVCGDASNADTLHRAMKMALDTGEVESVAAGYGLFRTYRLAIAVGPEAAMSPAHQAALLTAVNCARRAMLGGVTVAGDLGGPLAVPLPECGTLAEAVEKLGGRIVRELPAGVPTLVIGSGGVRPDCPAALAVTFADWRGGVIPTSEGRRLDESRAITPAAVLAGAVGVSDGAVGAQAPTRRTSGSTERRIGSGAGAQKTGGEPGSCPRSPPSASPAAGPVA